MRTAIVSGAGIAGLALSILLSENGWHVIIIEKDDIFRISRAGIHISTSGVKILSQLGIHNDDDMITTTNGMMRMMNQFNWEAILKTKSFNHTIITSRKVIHDKLLQIATKKYKVEIRMGSEIHTISRGTNIKIILNTGDELLGDVLIGADGLNSNVRKLINQDVPKIYAGYVGVGVVYPGHFKHNFTVCNGTMGMIGMSNLGTMGTDIQHKCLWSHVAMSETKAKIYAKEPLLSIGAVGQMYGGWGKEIQNEIDTILSNVHHEQFYIQAGPIYTKPIAQKWSEDNIILIGDAAHAFGPGGHGVTMALEDAHALSSILMTGLTTSALETFQHTRSIQAMSYGKSADKRNKGRLKPTHWIKVWIMGVIFTIISKIVRAFGWTVPL